MTSFMQKFAGLSKFLTVAVVVLLVVAGVVTLSNRGGDRYVTVNFPQANSLYKGSDVKVLGVPVGRVEKLTPKGDIVQVKLSYKGKYKLPTDVKAAIISPSIVGDRFVQLSPAYQGGAVLADNSTLTVDRTAVPVELDQVYSSISDLATALGPQGANKNGSLSTFIDTGAKVLGGQGERLNETIKNFSKLSVTLDNNKENLFGSLREVETFVSTLKQNDSSVRAFNDSTARVSTVLAGERNDLAGTLKSLSLALIDVKSFIGQNRTVLRDDVDNLQSITEVLAKNQRNIKDILVNAPTAASNVAAAYNAKYGALDNRSNIAELLLGGLTNPAGLLCSLLGQTPTDPLCGALGGILGGLSPGAAASAGGPPDLTGLTGALSGATGSKAPVVLPRAAVSSGTPRGELVNDSVRGMLEVN